MYKFTVTICSFLFLCTTLEVEGSWSCGGTPRKVSTSNGWPVSYTYGDKTTCQQTLFYHGLDMDHWIGANQYAIGQNQAKIDDLTRQIKAICPDFIPMFACSNQSVQLQVNSLYAQIIPLQKDIDSWNENIKNLTAAKNDDINAASCCI